MKKMPIIIIVFLFLIAVFVYNILPEKYAVKREDLLNSNEAYYLVEWVRTTGIEWMIVGDQTGLYSEAKYAMLIGEVPDIVSNYSIATARNTYVCYGEYIGEKENTILGETLSEYIMIGWDILYPIKRNTVLPFWPSSYLSRMDMKARR